MILKKGTKVRFTKFYDDSDTPPSWLEKGALGKILARKHRSDAGRHWYLVGFRVFNGMQLTENLRDDEFIAMVDDPIIFTPKKLKGNDEGTAQKRWKKET